MNKITFKQFDQKHSKKPETKKNKDPTPYEFMFDYAPTPPTSRGFNLNWDDVAHQHMIWGRVERETMLNLEQLEQQYQQISRRQNEYSSF